MEMKLEHLRKEYLSTSLNRDDLREDPYDQFQHWFQQARAADLIEPNAMSLATVDRDGSPSIRTVLLKTVDHEGFVFFTNKQSQKALDIASNPCVALLFPWLALERQVKVIGKSEAVPKEQARSYFARRPRGSQLGAWVSHQSSVVSSRTELEGRLQELIDQFADREIPLPDFWGGYRVKPYSFEFWQGRSNRLHDRFRYTLSDGTWLIDRLAP
jgi:pyridoxamine 5'-phosphate oxidase|tara:strand:- start:8577 stop:9218 length:642 start_codon:yes stop_codon:yes gene_type:complete